MLAEALTKSDEIKLFESIVEGCPEGYVKDILSDIALQVHAAIRNDFGCITADLKREVEDLRTERDKLAAEVKQVREQGQKLNREYNAAVYTIRQSEALAKQLKATVASIRDL